MATQEEVIQSLKTVPYPGFSRDIVSFGLVREVRIEDDLIEVNLALTTADQDIPLRVKETVEQQLTRDFPTTQEVNVVVAVSRPAQSQSQPSTPGQASQPTANPLSGVKHVIAIASGKGGVGKSTFATNLACALNQILLKEGKSQAVGIMDCDIYGPSIPLMMGIHQQPEIEDNLIIPLSNFDIEVMSMGFLVDPETPVIWRGPMIMKTIQQFAQNVKWGDLEVLVIDLPPGTGDAQLSLVQTIQLDGAVVVTTPQPAAVNVARRGARMFGQVNVPLIGVAENMSYLEMPDGGRSHIFGEGGGPQTAVELQTGFLGQIPLDTNIREGSDHGTPIVLAKPDSLPAKAFHGIAVQVLDELRKPDQA